MSGASTEKPLTAEEAIAFFGSLYEDYSQESDDEADRGAFYEAATGLIAKSESLTAVGPTALQALMLEYLLSNQAPSKGAKFTSAIAHISRPGVASFVRSNPGVTLEALVSLARKNGFEVEILER